MQLTKNKMFLFMFNAGARLYYMHVSVPMNVCMCMFGNVNGSALSSGFCFVVVAVSFFGHNSIQVLVGRFG